MLYGVLWKKHAGKFCGFLRSRDAFYGVEDEDSRQIVTALFMVKCKDPNAIVESIKAAWGRMKDSEKYNKFSCTVESYYGYSFWKRIKIDPNLYVRKVDVTKDDFKYFLGRLSNAPLPNGGKGRWDVLVGTKNIGEEYDTDVQVLPVLIRLHQTLGDGVVFLSAFKDLINFESSDYVCESEGNERVSVKDRVMNVIKYFYESLVLVFIVPGFQIERLLLKRKERNVLFGSRPTGEKMIDFLIEKDFRTLEAMKRIKERVDGVTFGEILLTGFSYAVYNYMRKVINFYFIL